MQLKHKINLDAVPQFRSGVALLRRQHSELDNTASERVDYNRSHFEEESCQSINTDNQTQNRTTDRERNMPEIEREKKHSKARIKQRTRQSLPQSLVTSDQEMNRLYSTIHAGKYSNIKCKYL